VARFHLRQRPTGVDLDGGKLPPGAWAWDADARVLTVGVAAGTSPAHSLDVSLDPQALPERLAPVLTAETIDPKGEVAGSGGRPTPHFFPAPAVPATLKASNYDNGGEGIAFHTTRPLAPPGAYREDNIGLSATNDAGGGYVLAGLQAGEWARYSVDCGNGGYFDLTVRAASAKGGGRIRIVALDQTLATIDVGATGGPDVFRDFRVPTVYLNPGEISLLVYVEAPGFALNSIALQTAAAAPSAYDAPLAFRRGVADVWGRGEEGRPLGYVRNLGRAGSSITFGVLGGAGGARSVRIHYSSNQAGPVALALSVGDDPAVSLPMQPTANEWKSIDVPVTLAPGANRLRIEGREDGWSSVQVDRIEILPR
jgi:hypothetical protein